MSWLSDLLDMHSEVESPKEFWRWAGLAILSAVAKDNVYLERAGTKVKYYKLYPNIYVMLYADSGARKGPPIALAADLVSSVNNTKIIDGRSSIQGILGKLKVAQSAPGGKIVQKSTGFIVASEFSSSLVNDPAAMNLLTDLYDRHFRSKEWSYLLKSEEYTLFTPTVTMLVATNEAQLEGFIEAKDKKGGFMGRTFVISESEVQVLNPLVFPMKNPPDPEKLIPHLKEISKLNKPFRSLHELPSGKLYHEWYMDFYTSVKDQEVKDKTGTVQRFGDSVLKVAMLLSLSDSTELVITENQMLESINICERLIGDVRKTTLGKTEREETHSGRVSLLIQELVMRQNQGITFQQLNKKYWMQGNATEWLDTCKSMQDGGMLSIENIGTNVIIKMTDDEYPKMVRFFKGKMR